MSGGKAIEFLAKRGNRLQFDLRPPMQRAKNCDFSFTGLQHIADKIIMQKEREEGMFLSSQVKEKCSLGCCLKIPVCLRHREGSGPVIGCRHRRCSAAHSCLPHCQEDTPCPSVLPAERLVTSEQRCPGRFLFSCLRIMYIYHCLFFFSQGFN